MLLPQFGVEASIQVDGVLKDEAWPGTTWWCRSSIAVVRVTVAPRRDAGDAVVLGLVGAPEWRGAGGEEAADWERVLFACFYRTFCVASRPNLRLCYFLCMGTYKMGSL